MKKTILITFLILFVLFFAALFATPFLFKDQLQEVVKQEINNRLEAKVDFKGVSISLLHSFPDLSVSLNELTVTGKDQFKDVVLADVSKLYISFDLMSVIKGVSSDINSVELYDPVIDIRVLKDGAANYEVYSAGETAAKGEIKAESQVNFTIQKYKIRNANISYKDLESGYSASIEGMDHEGNGDFQKDQFVLNTKTDATSVSFFNDAIPYLSKVKLEMKADLDMDLHAEKFTLKENVLKLNNLEIKFDGIIDQGKESLDLKFSSLQNDFKSILSMIPAIYKKDFASVQTQGKMGLKGNLKGSYRDGAIPGFLLDLSVSNGMFKYPDLPVAVSNININAKVSNPGGTMDYTIVDLSKGHLEVDKSPIDFMLNIKNPISDPLIKTKVNGELDLARIPEFYPMEDVVAIEGNMLADVMFEGKVSDVRGNKFSKVKADGEIRLNKIRYESENLTMPVFVDAAQISFNPRNATIEKSFATVGNSDFDVTGTLDNLIGYLLTDEKLTGELIVRSKQLDANEWVTQEATASGNGKEVPTEFFKVPDGLDVSGKGYIDKILYDNIEITNVSTKVAMTNETLHLSDFKGNLMGGSARMNGSYSTKDVEIPKVKLSYEVKGFDAVKTYEFFEVAQGFAPIMQYIEGKFDSDLTIDGVLTEDLDLDLTSVTGNGLISISNANLKSIPVLEEIAKLTKVKQLTNISLKDAWTVFEMKDGRIEVEPFDVKKGNIIMNVSGSNGLDYSIDYKAVVDVPSSELGNGYALVSDWIAKNPIPGLQKAVPEIVQLHLNIGGTFNKPKISLGKIKAKQEKSVKEQVTEDVKQELEQQKEKAKEEVKKQVDAVKEEVNQEVEKAKQEAEKKAKEEIEKTREKTKKKLKDIFGVPKR